MKSLPATALMLSLAAVPLAAEAPITGTELLTVNGSRTFKVDKPIGRVEIDRDGIIAVRAPTVRSLTVKGIGLGDAQLSVYGKDGSLLGTEIIHVAPAPSSAMASIGTDARLRDVSATRGGDGVSLSGDTDSLDARQSAHRFAQSANEGAVANRIAINSEQVVAVDVQFAAVSSTTLKALGFNFSQLSGSIQGAVVSPSSLTSYAFQQTSGSSGALSSAFALSQVSPLAAAFNLFLASPNHGIGAVLSALSSNGLSQLLAEPTLLVRSGETANFLAGGEVPIPVPSGGLGNNTITIQYKEFGVRLSVAPVVLSKDRIVLKIAPEVSELDYSNGVQLQGYTVPGIRRRSAETTVQLGSGQSFVIAGLTYTNSSLTKDKVPGLGDLPVLGAFFKRQQNQHERQELIIVATPRLVGPVEAGTLPPLPGTSTAGLDPSFGQMILGTDGLEKRNRPFGVVRR